MHYNPNHSNKSSTDPIPVYVERSLNLEPGRGYALKSEGKRQTFMMQRKDGRQTPEWDVVAMNRVKGALHLPHYWRLFSILLATSALLCLTFSVITPNPPMLVFAASVLLILWGSALKFAFEEHVKVAIKLAPVHGHPLEDVDVVLAAIPKHQYYQRFVS